VSNNPKCAATISLTLKSDLACAAMGHFVAINGAWTYYDVTICNKRLIVDVEGLDYTIRFLYKHISLLCTESASDHSLSFGLLYHYSQRHRLQMTHYEFMTDTTILTILTISSLVYIRTYKANRTGQSPHTLPP
jgi:hypothetical protein